MRRIPRSWKGTLLIGPLFGLLPAGEIPASSGIDPDSAIAHWRQVGWMSDQADPCPAPGVPWQAPITYDLGGERFCIYLFQGLSVSPQHLAQLGALPNLDELGPDRMAVRPMAGLDELLSAPQATSFLQQAGGLSTLPAASSDKVLLALLDTQPDSDWTDPEIEETSEHGKSLRAFAEELLCSGPQCPVLAFSRLTLPYVAFDPYSLTASTRNEAAGGLVGTIAELAMNLVDETTDLAVPGERKVINLSVAWDGALFGGLETGIDGDLLPSAMPVDVRFVFRALQGAADSGVLVVAAAGNRSDHRQAAGPLLPAAWERHPVELGDVYRPLVYAVAGVDSEGLPLINAQPDSLTPVVAYGDHGVLAEGEHATTGNLTGSSVSSLVVSAAAAAVWHYAPWLEAADVMDVLYASGDVLAPLSPEVCLPHPDAEPCASLRPEVRRISICGAVDQICQFTGDCPFPFDPSSPSPCDPWAPTPPPAVDLGAFAAAGTAAFGAAVPVPTDLCGLPVLRSAEAADPADPCPTWQFDGLTARAWVNPQPGTNPCPNCPVIEDTLHIQLADGLEETLHSPTLVLCELTVSLPVPTLGPDLTTFEVTDLPVPDGCRQGVLTFAADDGLEGRVSTFSSVSINP